MKLLLVPLLLCCVYESNTQTVCDGMMDNGIYFTDTDYMAHHLQFSFNNQERHSHKFKDPFFHWHQLWLNTTDSTYKFYYDDI